MVGLTQNRTDLRSRVAYWRCPYCEEYTGETASEVRSHVTEGNCGSAPEGVDPDRHVPGHDDDDRLIAVAPDGGADEEVVPIDEVESVPDSDGGGGDDRVAYWQCPYCGDYTNDTEQGIRSHVTGTNDADHAGKSGWNPDRDVPGYDGSGELIALITAVEDDDDESTVVAVGEFDGDVEGVTDRQGERIRGEKKTNLVNAWLADPEAHYTDLARVTDTSERYAHRVKRKLEDGAIAEVDVEAAADPGLQDRYAEALSATAEDDPRSGGTDAGTATVPASEVERVRGVLEMYREEAEFEAESLPDDEVTVARAKAKEFVAGRAVELLDELLAEARE